MSFAHVCTCEGIAIAMFANTLITSAWRSSGTIGVAPVGDFRCVIVTGSAVACASHAARPCRISTTRPITTGRCRAVSDL